tara:strand:- start:752 stop:1114 length:363 start_codon:yes stop_codon:yes gene_type:complete
MNKYDKDALLHKLQTENEEYEKILWSWIQTGMLDRVPTYEEFRDVRNAKARAVINEEQLRLTIARLTDKVAEYNIKFGDLEELPDEDLWEDGELTEAQVFAKIGHHIYAEGDWKIMRRKK